MFGFGKDDEQPDDERSRSRTACSTPRVQGIIGRAARPRRRPARRYRARRPTPRNIRSTNVAYGVLVGAAIGKGKVTYDRRRCGTRDARRDRCRRPTSTPSSASPQQGGETKAPTQGVRDIEYFGEIVAIVLGESYEAARDAAIRLPVDLRGRRRRVRLLACDARA